MLASLVGSAVRAREGRRRAADGSEFRPGALPGLDALGASGTLVQFSTQLCARCPGTRRVLQQLAAEREGVRYLDVDLTDDVDLAARLHILQTPTVFVLDPAGRLAARYGGPPRRDQLVAEIDRLAPACAVS